MPDDALKTQLSRYQAPYSELDGEQGRPPTEAEYAVPRAAPSSPALFPVGILWQAPWQSPTDGFARHARQQALALARSGLPVALVPLGVTKVMIDDFVIPAGLDPSLKGALDRVTAAYPEIGYVTSAPRHIREMQRLADTTLTSAALSVRMCILHSAAQLELTVCPPAARFAGFEVEKRIYASSIVYTSWERATVPEDIVRVLNRCAEVWVPCAQNQAAFERSGVKRVHVMPCPYDGATSLTSRLAVPFGSSDVPDGKRFYTIGKWEPRKNQALLIYAFLREFKATERVSLYVKTSPWGPWKNYPSPPAAVELFLEEPTVIANGWTKELAAQRVRVSTKRLSEEALADVHRANNIYVSASSGEAWDLPAFDAKCAGNRLVYNAWTGPCDYAADDDIPLPLTDYLRAPADPEYGWEPGAQWAEVPLPELQDALRRAMPPAKRVHPKDFYSRFGMQAVGEQMKLRILECAEALTPGLATRLVTAGGYG